MGYPKQIKKTLPLSPVKTLFERREQLLEYINKDGTYLPKSVLHADLDRGMLDFAKQELKVVSAGKEVPLLDIILTNQNWAQFTETWEFANSDFNAKPPFITVVRNPEVKYGTNPALLYTIPVRKQFYYASVPTWNGNEQGMDVYTIPQPVPVDVTYSLKIVCNRMRELNQLNKVVMQHFTSRQSYTFIKGQYVPIILNNISDESVQEIDKRKYYIQSYEFIMLGYLIDEEEFEVKPAIQRVMALLEVEDPLRKRPRIPNTNPRDFNFEFLYVVGNNSLSDTLDYMVDMNLDYTTNIDSFDVYINGDYYGTNVNKILVNTNDSIRVDVVKTDDTKESIIKFINRLD